MTLTTVVFWTLLQIWFGYPNDRLGLSVHESRAACEAAKAKDVSAALCLGPYAREEAAE